MQHSPAESSSLSIQERLILALAVLVVAGGIALQLGSRTLFEPDEGRNAEVMREMSVSGDYFVPRLDGLLFLDKPFLYYAVGGLAMRLLGATEVAARLPGVLCTLALGLGAGLLGRRWWGRRAGIVAGVATVAAPLPLIYTQIVIFDAMLALWIAVALAAFYLAVEADPAGGRGAPAWWSALAWTAMGLGVVTKGPVALLVPLAAALPWALWRRRARRLVARGAPLALVAVLTPWLWLVSRADQDFLHYALVTETWSRITSNELKRDAPFWFYIPVVLLGALPWSVVPLVGWRRLAAAWHARLHAVRYVLLWFVVPYLIFSALHSKRVHYVLPLVPALVLLSTWLWRETPSGARLPGVRTAATIWCVLGVALVALGLGVAPQLLNRVDGVPGATVAHVALLLGGAWVVGGVLAIVSSRAPLGALAAFTLPPAAVLLLTAPIVAGVGARRSSHELAAAIAAAGPPSVEVVTVETFPAALPFYLERPVTLVSGDGAPLRSNYILRRYPQMVGDTGPLRAPTWLAGAAGDCTTPRVFVVRRNQSAVRELLAGAGRAAAEGGRDYLLFGPCDAAGRVRP